jgi:hypothetical protein
MELIAMRYENENHLVLRIRRVKIKSSRFLRFIITYHTTRTAFMVAIGTIVKRITILLTKLAALTDKIILTWY